MEGAFLIQLTSNFVSMLKFSIGRKLSFWEKKGKKGLHFSFNGRRKGRARCFIQRVYSLPASSTHISYIISLLCLSRYWISLFYISLNWNSLARIFGRIKIRFSNKNVLASGVKNTIFLFISLLYFPKFNVNKKDSKLEEH